MLKYLRMGPLKLKRITIHMKIGISLELHREQTVDEIISDNLCKKKFVLKGQWNIGSFTERIIGNWNHGNAASIPFRWLWNGCVEYGFQYIHLHILSDSFGKWILSIENSEGIFVASCDDLRPGVNIFCASDIVCQC